MRKFAAKGAVQSVITKDGQYYSTPPVTPDGKWIVHYREGSESIVKVFNSRRERQLWMQTKR